MSEIMEYYSKSESEKSKITELVEELKEKMPCYTDIVILDTAKKEYLAIELKYKTAKLEMVTKGYGDISLKEQGANDYGCYDYLWDVQRIGDLISGENKEGNLKECRCVGGYAIFLTNEKKYWTYTREGRVDKNGYYDFCIGDGSDDDRDNDRSDDRSIKKNRPLEWHCPGDPQKEGTRKYAITLSDKYLQEENFDWGEERNPFWTAPKESEGARKFRYLCLTLKPN